MNIYDSKPIRCTKCQKPIGEIDYDAHIIRPLCGQCYDPKPDVRDSLAYKQKLSKTEKIIPVTSLYHHLLRA